MTMRTSAMSVSCLALVLLSVLLFASSVSSLSVKEQNSIYSSSLELVDNLDQSINEAADDAALVELSKLSCPPRAMASIHLCRVLVRTLRQEGRLRAKVGKGFEICQIQRFANEDGNLCKNVHEHIAAVGQRWKLESHYRSLNDPQAFCIQVLSEPVNSVALLSPRTERACTGKATVQDEKFAAEPNAPKGYTGNILEDPFNTDIVYTINNCRCTCPKVRVKGVPCCDCNKKPTPKCDAPKKWIKGVCRLPHCKHGKTRVNGKCTCVLPKKMHGGVCRSPLNDCLPPKQIVNGVCQPPVIGCLPPKRLINGVCTDCLAPKKWIDGACRTPIDCPPPKRMVNGACTECVAPKTWVNGICQAVNPCLPPKEIIDGVCKKRDDCIPPKHLINGVCKLVDCPPPKKMVNGVCTECVAPNQWVHGICQPVNPCLPPKKIINGVCKLEDCLAPKKRIFGVCTECLPPKKWVNNVCKAEECVAPKQLINGECKLPVPDCAPPKQMVDGVCKLPTPVPGPCTKAPGLYQFPYTQYSGVSDKEVHVVVDIKLQKIRLYRGTTAIREYVTSTSETGIGSESGSLRTPIGQFQISEKFGAKAPAGADFEGLKMTGKYSKESDKAALQTRVITIEGLDVTNANTRKRAVFIHGTNKVAQLGQPASQGCFRLSNTDVIEFFNLVSSGTRMFVVAECAWPDSKVVLDDIIKPIIPIPTPTPKPDPIIIDPNCRGPQCPCPANQIRVALKCTNICLGPGCKKCKKGEVDVPGKGCIRPHSGTRWRCRGPHCGGCADGYYRSDGHCESDKGVPILPANYVKPGFQGRNKQY